MNTLSTNQQSPDSEESGSTNIGDIRMSWTYSGENADAGDNSKPVEDQVTPEEAADQRKLERLAKRLDAETAKRTTS